MKCKRSKIEIQYFSLTAKMEQSFAHQLIYKLSSCVIHTKLTSIISDFGGCCLIRSAPSAYEYIFLNFTIWTILIQQFAFVELSEFTPQKRGQ